MPHCPRAPQSSLPPPTHSSQRGAHGGMARNMILAHGGIKTVKTAKIAFEAQKIQMSSILWEYDDSINNVLQK